MHDEIEVTPRNEEELRQAAISSIRRKREFAQHLVSYVVVNAYWSASGRSSGEATSGRSGSSAAGGSA
ncbi:MAG TPA: hypothetical protein VLB79_00020 [Solirubrobacterales bacterium]|nr:hypothetical protein [Solirubrobacterales bacterium]